MSYETDAEGLLWMQNEIGISSYDGETWTPLPFSLPEVEGGAAFGAPKWTLGIDGSVWVATSDGITRIQPDSSPNRQLELAISSAVFGWDLRWNQRVCLGSP